MLTILAQTPVIKTPNRRAYKWCLARISHIQTNDTGEFVVYPQYYTVIKGRFIADSDRGNGYYYPIRFDKEETVFALAFADWTQHATDLFAYYKKSNSYYVRNPIG